MLAGNLGLRFETNIRVCRVFCSYRNIVVSYFLPSSLSSSVSLDYITLAKQVWSTSLVHAFALLCKLLNSGVTCTAKDCFKNGFLFIFYFLLLCACVFMMCMCWHRYEMVQVWRSEDTLLKSILFFHYGNG